MKKLFVSIAIALSALTLAAGTAHAKRMGGGKTTGKQSATAQKQAAAPAAAPTAAPAKPAAAPAAAPAAPARSKWMGPLAGLAAGLGIAALMSHFGMGGAMGEMLSNMLMFGLIAFAALMAFRWYKNRNAPKMAYVGNGQAPFNPASNPSAHNFQATPQHASTFDAAPAALGTSQAASAAAEPSAIPAGFDSEGFVRNAKVYFIRLQAAWDARNLHDMKEFTSPEMFAELKMQLAEDNSKNETDVVELNAQMLAVESDAHEHTASVRFYGQTRENGAAPAAFNEIWNLTKPVSGAGGWVLAGITQL